ncbi:hypothetical protein BSKO_06739 [Bryopsis sp. KO-2023]|nr:hypothetical protein BSKO_06739 [Bryopsis sp. KO-2023]
MKVFSVLLLAILPAAFACRYATVAPTTRTLLQEASKEVEVIKAVEFPFLGVIGTVPGTKSIDACQEACEDAEGCLSFTRMNANRGFLFVEGQCFLYPGIGQRQAAPDADSGILPPKVDKPVACTSTKGVTFLGQIVASVGALYTKDVGECCLRCQENEDCTSYTYLENDGTCWMKSETGDEFPCADCETGVVEGKKVAKTKDLKIKPDPKPPKGDWDFIKTGLLAGELKAIWKEIAKPADALSIAFRQLAFSVTGKSTFTLELPSGEEFKFGSIKTNAKEYYHVFKLESHTRGVVDGELSLRGSEVLIRLLPDVTGNTRLNFGFQANVDPPEGKPAVVPAFDGFFKTLVGNMKLKFGSGDCLENVTLRDVLGSCNNPENPSYGASNTPLKRLPKNDPAYADGKSKPSGPVDISPRYISNKIADEGTDEDNAENRMGLTDFHVYMGQFIDHDIGLSPTGAFTSGKQPFFSLGRDKFTDPFPITVPKDDEFFTGEFEVKQFGFARSVWVRDNNKEVFPRTHLNQLTSYLDLGALYASENVRAAALRSFKKGMMKTGKDDFLPFNGAVKGGVGISLENAPNAGSDFYVAGDIRANEVVGLVAMHALWLREHNLVASELDKAFKGKLDDNELFEFAKEITIAEYQSIVYKEYLPLILGKDTLDPSDWEYDPEIDASIDAFFTTVSFRFGHSMVNNFEWKIKKGSNKVSEKFLLRDVFFRKAGDKIDGKNLGDWIRGMSWHAARELDVKMVSEMRNFLFTKDPKVPSNDLTAMNIQRAREFGLPMYNGARDAHGLKEFSKFSDVTCNKDLAKTLEEIYDSVDDIDPFIGGLAECPSSKDRLLGDLFHENIKENFRRLRDGDRLFYKGFQFSAELFDKYPRLADIIDDKVILKDIVLRNTDSTEKEFKDRTNLMWLNK